MRNGDRKLARTLVTKSFEEVKRIQLQRYHKAKTNEEKDNIELDPFVVFHRAIDNCMPILQLIDCRKGGITYKVTTYYSYSVIKLIDIVTKINFLSQIPVPISLARAQHKSMKWLIEAAKEKEDEERFYDTLAKELVSACQNQVYKFYQLEI